MNNDQRENADMSHCQHGVNHVQREIVKMACESFSISKDNVTQQAFNAHEERFDRNMYVTASEEER